MYAYCSWNIQLTTTKKVFIIDRTSNFEYDFYIDASISGSTSPIKKLVKVTVINWSVNNWLSCSGSSTVCSEWYSGYTLDSGTWIVTKIPEVKASESAQAMTKTSQSMTGSTAGVVGAFSLANTSSLSSLWSMVNQIQIQI